MQEKKIIFPQEFYEKHLSAINHVHFTNREIDVIACLLSARGTGKIAIFLSIDKRTIETHISNITSKLGCNSREGIIDFIEKSNKINTFRKYYLILKNEIFFKQSLKKIAKLSLGNSPHCLLIQAKDKDPFTLRLKSHLKFVGTSALIVGREKQGNYTLFILSQEGADEMPPYLLSKIKKSKNKVILLLRERKTPEEIHQELSKYDYIVFTTQENYFVNFFLLIKKLLPNVNLEDIINEFKEKYRRIDSDDALSNPSLKESPPKKFSIYHRWEYVLTVCFLTAFIGGAFLTFEWGKTHDKEAILRSDLPIPVDSVFLDRPELMLQIDEAFKGSKGTPLGIQTLALVGTGGAGKTTTARQYAHKQKASIIWEINATTNSSLIETFENLSHALIKTEKDKIIFCNIQEINNISERETKIINFVKEKLRVNSNWFLIYDNVEKFTNIQKYFPLDIETWGYGKIILTTRDSNIQNNQYVNYTLPIGELADTQKMDLFTKIMIHGNIPTLTPTQLEKTKLFLRKLPSFPLDVVIAASYFRSTNVSFNKYLELISKEALDFINFEKALMESIGNYAQTRHGIISLSLENIINTNEDFKKLLFFVSLIDNQKIPTVVLELIADKGSVDCFIYNLNKYSLITNMELIESLSVFSIHNTTHEAIKKFIGKVSGFPNKLSFLKFFASLMRDKMYTTSYEETNLPQTKILLNHCVKFLNSSELPLGKLKQDILSEIGRAYFYLGEYSKAKLFLDESFLIYEKRKKEDVGGYENIRLLSFIGDLYGQGMLTGAFEKNIDKLKYLIDLLEREIYKISKKPSQKFLGEGYLYLSLFNTFLVQIKNENKIDESITKICNHAEAENNLANFNPYFLDSDLEKIYKKAYDLAQQGLNIVLAEDKTHKRAGIFYHYIAYLSSFLNESKEMEEKSKEMVKRGREIYKKSYAQDNIRIGWSSLMLASLYLNRGLHEKASTFYKEGLSIYKKYYGSNHNQILFFENQMAYNLILLGKFDEAETVLKENLNKPVFSSNINIKKTIHLLIFLYQKKINNNRNSKTSKVLRDKYVTLLSEKINSQERLMSK